MEKPWMVAGNFNDFTNHNEKRSYSPNYNHNRAQRFAERINNYNLIDLGNVGPKLTWTNNKKGLANTMERLDRAVSNDKWRALFPEGTVRTLPKTYSDHSPLVALTQGMHPSNPNTRPFRFEATWLYHPTFPDVITKSWTNMDSSLIEAIDGFTHNDDNGNWLSKSEDVETHINQHFHDLFHHEETPMLDNWRNIINTSFTKEDNDKIQAPITNHEIWNAIQNIKAFKAPGKDGLQAVFYHQN
ncbi:hypothetical protein ACSBR1_026324 [Camellia fascicularis]